MLEHASDRRKENSKVKDWDDEFLRYYSSVNPSLNPSNTALFEGSFFLGVVNLTSFHISRRTYLISI